MNLEENKRFDKDALLHKTQDELDKYKQANLTEVLEKYFSLHDVDMIYNLLQEFRAINTKQGEITFEDFLKEKNEETR